MPCCFNWAGLYVYWEEISGLLALSASVGLPLMAIPNGVKDGLAIAIAVFLGFIHDNLLAWIGVLVFADELHFSPVWSRYGYGVFGRCSELACTIRLNGFTIARCWRHLRLLSLAPRLTRAE